MRRHKKVKKRISPRARMEERAFFAFISPFILGFIIFGAFPMVFSFVLCFMKWDFIRSARFVGLDNIRRMLQDELFWKSLKATGLFTGFGVVLGLITGFLIALLMTRKCGV